MGKWKNEPGVDLTHYGKVPMNQLWGGRVVYAHIAYSDRPTESKTRPAVVVWIEKKQIFVCPMYSRNAKDRVELVRHGRRCYLDLRAVQIEQYNLVNLDPVDLDDETWDYIVDKVIFPKEEDEKGNELLDKS